MPPKPLQKKPAESRSTIIQTVQTPLGFFVLVVLIVEAMAAAVAAGSSPPTRNYVIVAMFVLLFVLIAIVAFFAYVRPEALAGMRPPNAVVRRPAPPGPAPLTVITRPRILCVATPTFEHLGFDEDVQAIRDAFGSDPEVQRCASGSSFRKLLTQTHFDIIHILGFVDTATGDLWFGGADDRIAAEALETLAKVSGARLVVLAACDSLALAARLSPTVNVVAGLGSIEVSIASEWCECFYRMLARGESLSAAHDIARTSTNCMMVLLLRENVLFGDSTRTAA